MATSSSADSRLRQQMTCPVCEESYDNIHHVPKGFPCQHSVCITCLQRLIERCDEDQLLCPLCRQPTDIPDARAAGFPNNLALLGMLDVMSSQEPQAAHLGKCPKHPSKPVCAVCVQCCQMICFTCLQKHHRDHDVDEVDEAMDRCIQQAHTLHQDITTTCSAIHESFTEKARNSDPDCFIQLDMLKRFRSAMNEITGTAPVGPCSKVASDQRTKQTKPKSSPVPRSLDLPRGRLPQCELCPDAINTQMFALMASAKLPDFKFIDVNRRNTLLLVSEDNNHAMYKLDKASYEQIESAVLSDESMRALKQAHHVILSTGNNIAISCDAFMMCDDRKYNMYGRDQCKFVLFSDKTCFVCASEGIRDAWGREILIEKVDEQTNIVETMFTSKIDTEYLVMPTHYSGGIVVYSNSYLYSYGVKVVNHSTVTYVTTLSPEKVELHPNPTNVSSGAMIGKKLLLLAGKKIDVYDLKLVSRNKPENRVASISEQELGLDDGCKIARIWAGDAPRGQYVLHVLYRDKTGHHNLAAYSSTQ